MQRPKYQEEIVRSAAISPLHQKRLEYTPEVSNALRNLNGVYFVASSKAHPPKGEDLRAYFPKSLGQSSYILKPGAARRRDLCIGVVFSGGPAAGGHNVVAGIWDALQQVSGSRRLVGFLDGPSGIIGNKWKELQGQDIAPFRNQGGFDLIGSGRTKIETPQQMASALATCKGLGLDGLIVVGGDDSNTNAALLAEYFLQKECQTHVIGVPKTIDGDLRSEEIAISFGFDSACKTFAEMIGNVARDALSTKKYYHFIKLMGRSASHVTLECALATHPNLALIGEEGKSLKNIVQEIADLIIKRKQAGKEYGVILVPEGLVEFVPEIKGLIQELNRGVLEEKLPEKMRSVFDQLPQNIQKQLLFERDPHGNVAVSQIETEQLLMNLVTKELKTRGYSGKFVAQEHFFGYEGRSCLPSNFDAKYCYTLGQLATLAIRDHLTGMIAAVQHLTQPVDQWTLQMVPIIHLMHKEMRKGIEIPVVKKVLVDLKGSAFIYFSRMKPSWEVEDQYRYPGPIQFFGTQDLTDSVPLSLTVPT